MALPVLPGADAGFCGEDDLPQKERVATREVQDAIQARRLHGRPEEPFDCGDGLGATEPVEFRDLDELVIEQSLKRSVDRIAAARRHHAAHAVDPHQLIHRRGRHLVEQRSIVDGQHVVVPLRRNHSEQPLHAVGGGHPRIDVAQREHGGHRRQRDRRQLTHSDDGQEDASLVRKAARDGGCQGRLADPAGASEKLHLARPRGNAFDEAVEQHRIELNRPGAHGSPFERNSQVLGKCRSGCHSDTVRLARLRCCPSVDGGRGGNVLEVRGVTKRYGTRTVLDDVSASTCARAG